MKKMSQVNRFAERCAGRQVVALGLFCAAAVLLIQPAEAQQFVYNNFSSPAGIQFNGSAAVASNGTSQVLRITPAALDQVGTAWYTTQVSLAKGFSTTFRFQISGTTSFNADGFAFVIQNGSFCNMTSGILANEGPLFVGDCPSGEGGSLGYLSLTHSLAIEFDTFKNGGPGVPYGDLSNSEVGIQSCGAAANTVDHTMAACNFGQEDLTTLAPTPINLADGAVHTATISYSPGENCDGEFCSSPLVVTIDGEQVLSTPFDMSTLGLDANQDAYVGFTGATGGLGGGDDNQDILSWSFDTVQTKTLGGPGTTATFFFNTDTYKLTGLDNQGGEQVTVDAFAVPASLFPAFAGFLGETCVAYADYSTGGADTCVEFQVHCQVSAADTSACDFNYLVATGYDLPADLSGGIGGPDFLVAHGADCTLTSGSRVQSIFLSYEATMKDPTTRGGSKGPSCFVATFHPSASPITTGIGFVGWGPPVVNTDLNQLKAGATRPLTFEFFDNLGQPVTNLSLCNSFTGTVCNDFPTVMAPWINFSSVGIACPNGAATNAATDVTVSFPGNSGLQNNGGGSYQLNWKTLKGWQGFCSNVQVTYFTGGAANVVLFPASVGFKFN
jgi:hypothetical protein